MDSLCLNTTTTAGIPGIVAAADVRTHVRTTPFSSFSFKFKYPPLKSLWPAGPTRALKPAAAAAPTYNDDDDAVETDDQEATGSDPTPSGNWVLKILRIRSLWGGAGAGAQGDQEDLAELRCAEEENDRKGSDVDDDECQECRLEQDDQEEEHQQIEFDKDSFSKLLRKVSLAEARLYAQMSYLGNLAYCIPNIQPQNLLRRHSLRFVTSSIEKKKLAAKTEKHHNSSSAVEETEDTLKNDVEEDKEGKEQKNNGYRISPSAAYHIAASAASYLHSHTRSILPFKSSKDDANQDSPEESIGNMMNADMASLMATTDSVTSVVAAKEEVKQAVADDLNSKHSSPCDWFICDDDQAAVRFLVIQGSESLASWQANLLFEPIQFEGLDVLVHRGIYEAAKGIYEQVLPEVHAHLKSRGNKASFRFTGHSLGGSLALLINLMLLIRGEVSVSSLLPVITFGSPCIMCGGDQLLHRLGLPRSHIQAITLHRDIVPRAFSCNYPNHVAELLKALSGNFRNHPCLNNQKLLYSPMGELLILQPDEKFSPNHHLLPSGSGLYILSGALSDDIEAEKQLRAAKLVFLNSPHPLEILSDRSAYGSEGCIHRDHDMNSYLKCVRGVIRQELNHIRKDRRQQRRKVWWPFVSSRGVDLGIIVGRPFATMKHGQYQVNFSRVLQTGKESVKRFSRLVASQHMHLFVVLLIPARLILLGAYSVIGFR